MNFASKPNNSLLSSLTKYWLGLLFISVTVSCDTQYPKTSIGAVSTAAPEATKIGMDILMAGGNAADAAVAIGFALGIAEPAMSGIGGGVQIQILLPGERIPFAINGTTYSPSKASTGLVKDSMSDIQRTTIPSMLKTMEYLKQNHGNSNISWKDLIAPSIELGQRGIELGLFRMAVFNKYKQKLYDGLPATSDYLPDAANGKFYYPKLVNTYRLIAEKGSDVFYNGEISEGIVTHMEAAGGFISREDLNNSPTVNKVKSVHLAYNGHDVFTQPEPCGGWVVLEILRQLDSLGGTTENIPLAIYNGHQKRISVSKTTNVSANTGETTHYSVVDSDGMWIGVTASINAYYGNGVAHPDFGFLYNSYMDDFVYGALDNKYAVGPQKMAYSSMSPTIVLKENKPVLVIGSPGSSRIISTIAQLIHNFTDSTYEKKSILEQPRVHTSASGIYFESAELKNTMLARVPAALQVKEASIDLSINHLNPYYGGVHAIYKDGDKLIPLADPRRDGTAIEK